MMAKSGNRTYGKRDAGVWACRMQGALVRRTGIGRFVSDNGGWRDKWGKGAGSVQGTVVCSWNVVEKKQEHIFSFCMLS